MAAVGGKAEVSVVEWTGSAGGEATAELLSMAGNVDNTVKVAKTEVVKEVEKAVEATAGTATDYTKYKTEITAAISALSETELTVDNKKYWLRQ